MDSLRQVKISVRYGAGRGGFSLTRPRPGPTRTHSLDGPRLLPPIFNWDPSGVWVGRGPERRQGLGMLKKTPRPWPLSGAGRGKGPGAPRFPGRRAACNELYLQSFPAAMGAARMGAPRALVSLSCVFRCFIATSFVKKSRHSVKRPPRTVSVSQSAALPPPAVAKGARVRECP